MLRDLTSQKKVDPQVIVAAIESLKAKGWDINPNTVADEAKVARSAVYRNPELLELVNQARTGKESTVADEPSKVAELEQRNAELEDRLTALELENERLARAQQATWQEAYEIGLKEGRAQAAAEQGRSETSPQFYAVPPSGVPESAVAGPEPQGAREEGLPSRALESAPEFEPPAGSSLEPVAELEPAVTPPLEAVQPTESFSAPPLESVQEPEPLSAPPLKSVEEPEPLSAPPLDVMPEPAPRSVPLLDLVLQSETLSAPPQDAMQEPEPLSMPPLEAVEQLETLSAPPPDSMQHPEILSGQPLEAMTEPAKSEFVSPDWLGQHQQVEAAEPISEVYVEPVPAPADFAGEQSYAPEAPVYQDAQQTSNETDYAEEQWTEASDYSPTPANSPHAYAGEQVNGYGFSDDGWRSGLEDSGSGYADQEEMGSEPGESQDDPSMSKTAPLSEDDLRDLLKFRFGRTSQEAVSNEPEQEKKLAGTKFVGSARPTQEIPKRDFVVRQVPPEIRKACLVLGLRPEDLTREVVLKAWKKEMANPGTHPDVGGDTEIAVYINTAKDTLVRWIDAQAPKLGKQFGKGGREPEKRDDKPNPQKADQRSDQSDAQ